MSYPCAFVQLAKQISVPHPMLIASHSIPLQKPKQKMWYPYNYRPRK